MGLPVVIGGEICSPPGGIGLTDLPNFKVGRGSGPPVPPSPFLASLSIQKKNVQQQEAKQLKKQGNEKPFLAAVFEFVYIICVSALVFNQLQSRNVAGFAELRSDWLKYL